MEPEYPSPGLQAAKTLGGKPSRDKNISSVELLRWSYCEDPANDMDEDLSKVPKDYGKLRGTKKTQIPSDGLLGFSLSWIILLRCLSCPA